MQHILQINDAKMSRFLRKKRDKTNNFNYIKCQISSKFGILYIFYLMIHNFLNASLVIIHFLEVK